MEKNARLDLMKVFQTFKLVKKNPVLFLKMFFIFLIAIYLYVALAFGFNQIFSTVFMSAVEPTLERVVNNFGFTWFTAFSLMASFMTILISFVYVFPAIIIIDLFKPIFKPTYEEWKKLIFTKKN